jgi:hypothetical protein
MHLLKLQVGHRTTAFAAWTLLIVGLAGCAPSLTSTADRPPPDTAPYVGVFTGEFVEGRPLYRFPALEIVGSRSSIAPTL